MSLFFRALHLSGGEKVSLAGAVIDTVVIGYRVTDTIGIDGKPFNLVHHIAVGGFQVRNKITNLLLANGRQLSAQGRGLELADRNLVQALDFRSVTDLVVTLDDVNRIAISTDLGEANPTGFRLLGGVVDRAPFARVQVIADQLDALCRICDLSSVK